VAWRYLVDSSGNPIVKVHMFGESTLADLLDWPSASADSSSWLREHSTQRGLSEREVAESVLRRSRVYTGLEREVQKARPGFNFYFAVSTNSWSFPMLVAMNCRKLMVSYAYLKSSPKFLQRLRTFVKNPGEVLATEPYKRHMQALVEITGEDHWRWVVPSPLAAAA
jgi:hypothetical protein